MPSNERSHTPREKRMRVGALLGMLLGLGLGTMGGSLAGSAVVGIIIGSIAGAAAGYYVAGQLPDLPDDNNKRR